MSYEQVYAELYGEATQEQLLADKAKHKKRHARAKVKYAIQHGHLIKSETCEYADCRSKKDIQAHHPDYDYPLDVLWLCRHHHIEIHKYFGHRVLSY